MRLSVADSVMVLDGIGQLCHAEPLKESWASCS